MLGWGGGAEGAGAAAAAATGGCGQGRGGGACAVRESVMMGEKGEGRPSWLPTSRIPAVSLLTPTSQVYSYFDPSTNTDTWKL